jgi:hypothetical protein
MSHAQRRCTKCNLQVETHTPSCPECGGIDVIMVSGPVLSDLITWNMPRQTQDNSFGEEPMVRCAFCHRWIEAAEAYHSRFDGQAVCWTCKQVEA